jgi:quercetin dioxygenase-like cupin family protein
VKGEVITKRQGRDLILLLAGESITVTWYRVAHGEVGPEPHVHHEHTDAFYVLDGEMTFPLGPEGEPVRAPAGTFVAATPNVVHTFANESGADARFFNLHVPDKGFAAYLRGEQPTFDTAGPPADGGRPIADGIVTGPDVRLKADLPELWVAELDAAPDGGFDFVHELADGRVLAVRAPGRG